MAKYLALCSIWSYRQNKYYQPGETLELDDANARALFEKDAIQPAEIRLEKLEIGAKYHGTDDE